MTCLLSPRVYQDWTKGVNRFDIEGHAHIDYHGNTHGVFPLTLGFLANCGWRGAHRCGTKIVKTQHILSIQ
jgi:hypothetical protein